VAGADQLTAAKPLPARATTLRGALGALNADEVAKLDGPPSPTELVAATDT